MDFDRGVALVTNGNHHGTVAVAVSSNVKAVLGHLGPQVLFQDHVQGLVPIVFVPFKE